jgi:hypothetical protein
MKEQEPSVVELCKDQLEDCRRSFELGDTTRIPLAVKWCVLGNLPLPEWLAPDVEAATEWFFRKGGATGRGKGGGNLVRYKRQRIDRLRHQIALHELARRNSVGGTRADAFERASERLQGTFAQGSPGAVEDSHDKVQAIFKAQQRSGERPA